MRRSGFRWISYHARFAHSGQYARQPCRGDKPRYSAPASIPCGQSFACRFRSTRAPAALCAAGVTRELECRFDTACIDGRPCFASDMSVHVVFRNDGLAELHFGDQPARLAGVEITPDVADGPNSAILEQVSNGLAVRMAVLTAVKEQR